MKILHLTLEFPPQIGGIANYVINFAAHTPANETVVYAPFEKNAATVDSSLPFKVYRHKPYWFLWPHWLRMLAQVYKIVKKEGVTKIYVHQVLPGGYIAAAIKKLLKIPYVLFFHGTDLDRALASNPKKKRLVSLVATADEVVVNSRFLEDKLRKNIAVTCPVRVLFPAPADYFFNSIDPLSGRKLKAQLALQGKKVLLSVGRMVPGKGFATLARLLPRVLEEFPDVVWIAIGEGSERQKVLDTVTKTDVQHVCRFLGAVPSRDLPPLYQVADIFILLTGEGGVGEEGWGTVFAEAAASGIPVIAGKSGGTTEIVQDKKTGLLVNAGSDEEILTALRELLLTPEYAAGLGQAGKALVAGNLTWAKQLEKFSL